MKKIWAILMFVVAFGMIMSSVSAVDLHPHDFNGLFTLDVPSDDFSRPPIGEHRYHDKSNNLYVEYLTIDDVHARNCANFDEYINECLRLEQIGTEGDLTIFKDDEDYVVTVHSDEELFIITDDDLDVAKAIALSADLEDKSKNDTNESSTPTSGNAELKSQDFYGFFKMDVPKDSDFGDTGNYDKRVVADSVYYFDEVNNITINYINNEAFDDKVVNDTVEGLKQSGANVSAEDDLYVISANGTNEIIFHDAPKTFIIISNQIDLDTLKDMASSIEITDN